MPILYTSEAATWWFAGGAFRRDVVGLPQTMAFRLRVGVLGLQRARNAEIGDFDLPFRRDQNVLRLQIAVDNAGPVGMGPTPAQIAASSSTPGRLEWGEALEQRLEVLAPTISMTM
jgi:hypothetical protein